MLSAKKTANIIPDDLDDVRDNPAAYGLPEEAKSWNNILLIEELLEFAEEQLVASKINKTITSKKGSTMRKVSVTAPGSASENIGSGNLPNKYYVSTSGDFYVNTKDDPSSFDWASETIDWKSTHKGETFGPFDTFKEALAKLEEESSGIYDGGEPTEDGANSVFIEDHISGVIFEEIYNGYQSKGKWLSGYKFRAETRNDTSFTSEKLGYDITTEDPPAEGEEVEGSKKKGLAMKKKSDYQGWTNYETWAVALWLGNEQGSEEMVREWAQEAKVSGAEASQVDKQIWTADEAAKYHLADKLKEFIEESNPLNDQASIYADILNGALSEVDWAEIAGHYLED